MHRFKSKVRGLGHQTLYRDFLYAANSSSWGLGSVGLYPGKSRPYKSLITVVLNSVNGNYCSSNTNKILKDLTKMEGNKSDSQCTKEDSAGRVDEGHFSQYKNSTSSKQMNLHHTKKHIIPCLTRILSSNYSSRSTQQAEKDSRKDISTIEDPFDDSPTYNIPEKPVTFVEGASYGIIILAGLGVASVAAYAVFKELIFQPKEYKIFGKALERVQNESQVKVRIGSPVTGYGQETRNRAARQRISNRVWKDEDDVEHVEVNFYIRGPHGAGKVFAEMFKDNSDKQWKFTYLIVEIVSPTHAQLMLESYVPA
ncbi:hypothetical protein KSP39_PZI000599 [Platanthera zijinensis]|uniref:Mitochondrial import inner membrane translocase subunit Tim21 n=1 Tax=Platanthera zijinensis TaxID=2320716 RepID=A0AAP0GF24_9ASPA